MTAWADHGHEGNGEPLAILLRPGNAGSNTAVDHIGTTRLACSPSASHWRRFRFSCQTAPTDRPRRGAGTR